MKIYHGYIWKLMKIPHRKNWDIDSTNLEMYKSILLKVGNLQIKNKKIWKFKN